MNLRLIRKYIKISILLLAWLGCSTNSYAQVGKIGKWHVKTGVSSYHINSLPDFNNAIDFSSEVGYRMKTGFSFGVGYSMAWVKTIYETGSRFKGLEGQEIHHAIRLFITRHYVIGKNNRHMLGLGTGALVLGEQKVKYDVSPTAVIELLNGEKFYQYRISQYKQSRLFHIPGFLFNTEYLFRFTKNISIGIRLEGLFLFDFGFDRYSIGPKVSAFF